jgi:hypothetical protein
MNYSFALQLIERDGLEFEFGMLYRTSVWIVFKKYFDPVRHRRGGVCCYAAAASDVLLNGPDRSERAHARSSVGS